MRRAARAMTISAINVLLDKLFDLCVEVIGDKVAWSFWDE